MQAENTFQPGAIWADTSGVHINSHGGGMLWHEGYYYWFGQHMIAGSAGNWAHVGVSCYQSTDLYHWNNLGIALSVSDDPHSDIVRGCCIERPKVLHCKATGMFVMGFHLELINEPNYSAARYGVAVSDHVSGPYRFLRSYRPDAGHWPDQSSEADRKPLTKEEWQSIASSGLRGDGNPQDANDVIFCRDFAGGQMSRDMTLFQDEDESAYHIFASEDNRTLHISQLSDDFLSHRGKYIRAFPDRFNEAPAIFKSHGKYWLISSACTGWEPNAARLGMADSIWGPWTELPNPCRGSEEQKNLTFESQSTFILPVVGRTDAFIFMADRWRPENAIDGRHVWLPIQFDPATGIPFLEWFDQWDLSFFDQRQRRK